MPNRFWSPQQQFFVNPVTGVPLTGGRLFFYAQGTTTKLTTYQDSALTSPNTNPVTLDAAGQAGNIFLQNLAYKIILAPPGSDDPPTSPYWTIDNVFTSDFSTPAQFQTFAGNPNGNLAGNQGTPGAVPTSVVWDSTDQLLYVCTVTGNAATAVWLAVNTTPAGVLPTGTVIPFAGVSAPAGFLLTFGQNVSRTTFAGLFAVIGTTYGSGDGVTTYGLPDTRGCVIASPDNMGGAAANRLTTATRGGGWGGLNLFGGLETNTLITAQLPTVTPAGTVPLVDPGHGHTTTANTTNNTGTQGGAGISGFASNVGAGAIGANTTGITASFSGTPFGSGAAHPNVQPTITINYMIKT